MSPDIRDLLDRTLDSYRQLIAQGAPLELLDTLERTLDMLADIHQRRLADPDGGVSDYRIADFLDRTELWAQRRSDDALPF
jgi:hypothetical protein